jgi:hypothetical protein
MINLHLHNYIADKREGQKDVDREKNNSTFKKLNKAHILEYDKRVSEYLKKCFKDALRIKVSLTPLTFRFFRNKVKD